MSSYDYIITPTSPVLAPYIEIEISDLRDIVKKRVYALIDTGYDGELVIPLNLYNELNLGSFESNSEKTITAETITGEKFKLRSSVGNIRIINSKVKAIIDTYQKFDEIIIGRSFLEKFDLSLKGCLKQLTLGLC